MALSAYRINSFTKPVSALDDKPQMSAAQLKEWFDSNSTKELKESVNGLIDELGEALSGKVDTADGKGLSSNDYTDEDKAKAHEHTNKAVLDKITAAYTTAEKTKLSGIAEGANKYIHPSSHSADMIDETAAKRFTSDAEMSGKVDTADGKGLSSNDYTDEDKAKVHTHANKTILDGITALPALATENLPRISWEEMDTFDGEIAVVEKTEDINFGNYMWTDDEGTAYYEGEHREHKYVLVQHLHYMTQVTEDLSYVSRDSNDYATQILYCPDGSIKTREGDSSGSGGDTMSWSEWSELSQPYTTVEERNRNEALEAQSTKQKADIDYIAMMCGIELESETEAAEDEQIQ